MGGHAWVGVFVHVAVATGYNYYKGYRARGARARVMYDNYYLPMILCGIAYHFLTVQSKYLIIIRRNLALVITFYIGGGRGLL